MREGRTLATRSLTIGETEEGRASQIKVTLARSRRRKRRWAPAFLRRRRKRRWAPIFVGQEEGGAGGENERRSGVAKKMCMHACAARGGGYGEKMPARQFGPWVFFRWTLPYGLDIVKDEIAKDY
jgi:hypothetical protein